MDAHSSRNYIIVTPKGVRKIPYDHNLIWLPMFYALPKELVEKRSVYLDTPRNIHQLLDSPEYMALIESDAFLEMVWNCYAWAVWQYIKVPKNNGTYHPITPSFQKEFSRFVVQHFAHLPSIILHLL